jgi:hypothetical protein
VKRGRLGELKWLISPKKISDLGSLREWGGIELTINGVSGGLRNFAGRTEEGGRGGAT